jgi:hypothetical protein
LGVLGNGSGKIIDAELERKCESVKFDAEVIELMNIDNEYMKPEE